MSLLLPFYYPYYMKQIRIWTMVLALTLCSALAIVSCRSHSDVIAGVDETEVIPQTPDYNDPTMWYTVDGDANGAGADVFYVVSTWEIDWKTSDGRVSHYADVWNPTHREHMGIEIKGVGDYMSKGNRFYAPYYRHSTIDGFVTENEDTIQRRTRLSMHDVCEAFDHFQRQRDQHRPLILAGFSQGGMAVIELLKHMDDATYNQVAAAYVMGYKVTPDDTITCPHIRPARGADDVGATICYNTVKDVRYVKPVISATCCGINPVNWRTDDTPAVLHDTITVTLSPEYHVLVVKGYSGDEYPPYGNFINVGDIHGCEPWLYKECIAENIALRTREWHKAARQTIGRIEQRGQLLVGTTGDYRPLSYREPETGEYWGFGIEMAKQIAKRLNVGVTFEPTSWPTLTADVLTDPQLFDLAMGGITITDARRETMLMSDGYLVNGKTILCRKDEASRFTCLADIDKPEVRVMVNPGGLNEKFARENLTHATIIVYDKNEEIPVRVAESDADVMITEITEAPWYVQNDERLAAPLLSQPFTHGQIGVLMRQGQDDLLQLVNDVIGEMKADGSLRQLTEKYGLVYGF